MLAAKEENRLAIAHEEVRASADYIKANLTSHLVNWHFLLYCLELFHRAIFKPVQITSPSLAITTGMTDGFGSWFVFRDKPDIDYGMDLPSPIIPGGCGLNVPVRYDHFKRVIGADLCKLPFPDNSFATIVSVHGMSFVRDGEQALKEIFRVLAPGGRCVYTCDTREWTEYKSVTDWSEKFFEDGLPITGERHLAVLEKCGATELTHRRFFDAPSYAALSALFIKMPVKMTQLLVSGAGQDPEIDAFIEMMHDVHCTTIGQELAEKEGLSRGVHLAVSFKKPGTLPTDLSVPEPVCPFCQTATIVKDIATRSCTQCNTNFPVQSGVPILLKDDHPSWKGNDQRQKSVELAARADRLLELVVGELGKGPFYVVNAGTSPVPAFSATNILLSCLEQKSVSVAGIYDETLDRQKTRRGVPVVHISDIANRPLDLVIFTDDRQQVLRLADDLKAKDIDVRIHAIIWTEADNNLHATLRNIPTFRPQN